MKRLFVVILMLTFGIGLSCAENTVRLSLSDGRPGDTITVCLDMSVTDGIVAAEFAVPIADGMTYVPNSFSLESDAGSISTSSVYDDRRLKVFLYSTQLDGYCFGSGVRFSFKVVLGTEPGSYSLRPDVILSDAEGEAVKVVVASPPITVLAPKMYIYDDSISFGHVAIRSVYTKKIDVSNIGTEALNVSSVSVSAEELGMSESVFTIEAGETKQIEVRFSPADDGFQEGTLTLNSDGASGGDNTVVVTASPYSVNELTVGDVFCDSYQDVDIGLYLDNMEDIAAVQCSIDLPSGISYISGSFTGTERSGDMKLFSSEKDGRISLYLYSETGKFISEGTGKVASFRMHAGVTDGTYELKVYDAILSDKELRNVVSDVHGGTVGISGPAISCDPVWDMGKIPADGPVRKGFFVANNGKKELVIESVKFTDSLLAVSNVLPITVRPGSSDSIFVEYKSRSAADINAVMSIVSNSPGSEITDVAIHGMIFEPNYITSGVSVSSDRRNGTVHVGLSNYSRITALQITVHGLENASVDRTSFKLSERCRDMSSALTQNDDGSVLVFVYSISNSSIVGNEGEILSFDFLNDVPAGDGLVVSIGDIVLSDESGKNISSVDHLTAGWDSSDYVRGDANCDGHVDVADISSVVGYIYGTVPDRFSETNADVNANGVINVTDISGIISIISYM